MANEQAKKPVQRKQVTNCDSCIHYVFDEEYADYACEVALDEDEMQEYIGARFRSCPYYQYKDEYINIRKQI